MRVYVLLLHPCAYGTRIVNLFISMCPENHIQNPRKNHAMKTLSSCFLSLLIVVSVAQIARGQQTSLPDVPHTLSYQGYLLDSQGAPVADGNYSVTLRMYTDAQGVAKVWEDAFTAQVRNGVFNILLGSGKYSLPGANVMSAPLWIGVQFADGDEMKPLTPLTSSPYALGIADNAVSSNKLQDGAVTEDKIGANYVGGIAINGVPVTGKGTMLNFVSTDNASIQFDNTSNSIYFGASNSSSSNSSSNATTLSNSSSGIKSVSGDAPVTATTDGSNNVTVGFVNADKGNILIGQGTSNDPAFKSVSGDVSIDKGGSATVTGIQGVDVSTTNPTNNQLLQYNSTTKKWTPATVSSSGGVSSLACGTGITMSGTSAVTVSNTGVLSVGANGALSSSGGQNPSISLSGIIGASNGGTGLSTTPGNGQILVGNGSGYALENLTGGTAVSINNAGGTVTVSNTGVTSNAAGAGISVSGPAGAVTISNTGVLSVSGDGVLLSSSGGQNPTISLTGVIGIANGGTGTSTAPGNGQILIGNGTGYTQGTITAGSNMTVLNTAGGITIASTSSMVNNGASAGQTLQWNNSTSLWQPSSELINTGTAVGVGTASPAFPLDVTGDVNTSTQFDIAGVPALVEEGTHNLFVGAKAGNATSSGLGDNTAVGYSALNANTSGFYNTAAGYMALSVNNTGAYNTGVGYQALSANTIGKYNTAEGYNALHANNVGIDNTAAGYCALGANTQANQNTAVGYNALAVDTSGSSNTAVGFSALSSDKNGYSNSAFGEYALLFNVIGYENTGIGMDALYSTTGNDNTALGISALSSNTTGSNNTALGANADVNSGAYTNATAIGSGAIATASNTMQLGNTSVTLVSTSGAVNSTTGYRVNGAAASGNYLRGNGTNFVSSGLQANDIPTGSGNYIQNGTSAQTASFNVSGAGTVGGNLTVSGATTLTALYVAVSSPTASGAYTVASGDHVVNITASSSVTSVSLPSASGSTGRLLTVYNNTASAVSVTPSGSDDIQNTYTNGSPYSLSASGHSITLVSDGSANWIIIGSN